MKPSSFRVGLPVWKNLGDLTDYDCPPKSKCSKARRHSTHKPVKKEIKVTNTKTSKCICKKHSSSSESEGSDELSLKSDSTETTKSNSPSSSDTNSSDSDDSAAPPFPPQKPPTPNSPQRLRSLFLLTLPGLKALTLRIPLQHQCYLKKLLHRLLQRVS